MDLARSRILLAGATGVIGGAVADALTARGARLALAGRDEARLAQLADRRAAHGPVPTRTFEAYDLDACAALAPWAAEALGGLDAVVAAFGTAAFGPAHEVTDAVAEHLQAVNALAPTALFRAALPLLPEGGAVLAVTGVVAASPQPGMADYSASKAALTAWLQAVRREQRRRGVRVVEARLGHLDTGFAERAVAGTPPPMPPAGRLDLAVAAIADALAGDAELVRPGDDGEPVLDRRAR
ncbi:SDR family NAD(P)-dependent oxidoreductase [Streptomyces sp. NPDC060194]|uniref:SDR family NAD(P)-dependent oxidoreductase n=1 Tax=Streptomyces sp. NPDC060194 TaxID=3347069 RepID=UPI0036681121